MNPLRRFLDWRKELHTTEHVEKASQTERVKRFLWMIASSGVALLTAFLVIGIPGAYFDINSVLVAILVFPLWFYLDTKILHWGMERFDLVLPWQFRDAEVEERETA